MKTEFVESVVGCLMKWAGRKYRNPRSLSFTFEDTIINYLIIYAVMKRFKIMFVSFIISYISFLEVSSNVVLSKQSCQQVDLKQS